MQSSDGEYTYPVVVDLPASNDALFTGSTANVVIDTGSVSNVVAVPTSAVETAGTRSYVLELDKGVLTRKVIKIGMVGDTYTQVLSGLSTDRASSWPTTPRPSPPPTPTSPTRWAAVASAADGGFFGGGGGAFQSRINVGPGGGRRLRRLSQKNEACRPPAGIRCQRGPGTVHHGADTRERSRPPGRPGALSGAGARLGGLPRRRRGRPAAR